jgi:hypothetical protein
MFDVYEKTADPWSRIVVASGGTLPPHVSPDEWQLVGQSATVSADIASDVERNKFYQYRTNVEFSASEILGRPNAT